MNDYVIGSGALFTAGPTGGVAAATLHAKTDPTLAPSVRAALVDFESDSAGALSQVLVMAAGWNGRRFEAEIVRPLMGRGECSLVDILGLLAHEVQTNEVHVFARWLPDEVMTAALRRRGVGIVAHPLESIEQAALISGQRFTHWHPPLRAA